MCRKLYFFHLFDIFKWAEIVLIPNLGRCIRSPIPCLLFCFHTSMRQIVEQRELSESTSPPIVVIHKPPPRVVRQWSRAGKTFSTFTGSQEG
jgi:hypothetical protein